MPTVEEYKEGRRTDTALAIKQANGNRAKLIALRKKRNDLANIYEDDGAIQTASSKE